MASTSKKERESESDEIERGRKSVRENGREREGESKRGGSRQKEISNCNTSFTY
jgi:hypothetical protein